MGFIYDDIFDIMDTSGKWRKHKIRKPEMVFQTPGFNEKHIYIPLLKQVCFGTLMNDEIMILQFWYIYFFENGINIKEEFYRTGL